MPAVAGPNLGLMYGWTPRNGAVPGESGWGTPMSNNMKRIDALLGLSVLSATTGAPVATAPGTRYIVPAIGTSGIFSSRERQIAVRVGTTWEFYPPIRGVLAEVVDTGQILKYDGANWVDAIAEVPVISFDRKDTGAWLLPDGADFTKIPLTTPVEDTANAWVAVDNHFLVPQDGLYMVSAMIRPDRDGADAMPANTTLMLGFGLTAADGIDVVATTSGDLNQVTLSFNAPMRFDQGSEYFLFGHHSAAAPIQLTQARLKLVRVGA